MRKLELSADIFLSQGIPASHIAHKLKYFFKKKGRPYAKSTIKSRLNLIENLWVYTEHKTSGKPMNTLEDVKNAVTEAWGNLDIYFVCCCIKSMPDWF